MKCLRCNNTIERKNRKLEQAQLCSRCYMDLYRICNEVTEGILTDEDKQNILSHLKRIYNLSQGRVTELEQIDEPVLVVLTHAYMAKKLAHS